MSNIEMNIQFTNPRTFGEMGVVKELGGGGGRDSCHGEMGTGEEMVYYGGDRLVGRVVLGGCERGGFDVVKVSFQGILQQSVYNVEAQNAGCHQMNLKKTLFNLVDVQPNHKFLDTTHSPTSINNSESKTLQMSFHFDIPRSTQLPTPSSVPTVTFLTPKIFSCLNDCDADLSPFFTKHFDDLPSSVCTSFSTATHRYLEPGWHGDCCIIYIIHASLIYSHQMISHVARPITIFSAPVPPRPPILIGDFPNEYQLHATRGIRSFSALGVISSGTISLKSEEPEAFVFRSGSRTACTVLRLDLESLGYPNRSRGVLGKRCRSRSRSRSENKEWERRKEDNMGFMFTGNGTEISNENRDMTTTAEVSYRVKATTFSCIRNSPFKAAPRAIDTNGNPWMTKSEKFFPKRSCTMQFSPWIRKTVEMEGEKKGLRRKATARLPLRFGDEAELFLPPPPTFESEWVVRRYTVLVQVVIKVEEEVRLNLNIPVQVVHSVGEMTRKGGNVGVDDEGGIKFVSEKNDDAPIYSI